MNIKNYTFKETDKTDSINTRIEFLDVAKALF